MVLVILIGTSYSFAITIKWECAGRFSCSAFSNPVQRFILTALWLNTIMNLLLVSLADPGYVMSETEYDCEQPITCSSDLLIVFHHSGV